VLGKRPLCAVRQCVAVAIKHTKEHLMDIHMIVKLKSSYEAWHELFVKDAETRSKMCNDSRTFFSKASDTTALVTLLNVDMEAMGAMMKAPISTN
jgi:hypothetical protein